LDIAATPSYDLTARTGYISKLTSSGSGCLGGFE